MSLSQPAKKRPRVEAQNVHTHSKEFPKGYGDFVFKSMDGVIFHFPRFLLSHVSPVFKDMYQLGENAPKQDIAIFTEDSKTLEYFLCHIDPAREAPQLDWDRVAGLLQAAEKYQVHKILKWFEREVSLSLTANSYPILPNPMLCLALARRFNLNMTARLSVRQLIKCPITDITGSPHVESSLLKHIFLLRVKRTQYLTDIIEECPDDPYEHVDQCPFRSFKENDELWKIKAIKRVVEEPSWSGIVRCTEKAVWIPCGCIPLEHVTQKEKVEKKEAEIPELSELGW
jgi:hypothetical protein